MDLGSDCSALESVEDNGLIKESNSLVGYGKVHNNGLCPDEADKLVTAQNMEANTSPGNKNDEGLEPVKPMNFGSAGAKSTRGSSSPTIKGYGLKKWRRVRRDLVKDTSVNMDNSKILKRGLSGSANSPSKATHFPLFEVKQNSEGSVGSVNLPKNINATDGLTIPGLSPDSRFATGLAFSAGTDSENSEDQSSKSSTAASAPKLRYDLPVGYASNKQQVKNLSGKIVGSSSAQRVQRGKSLAENSKKPRGERIKIEKENSHSSLESDSRSSNFVFMQGAFSMAYNGKQSERIMNNDGENSDEAHDHANEQTSYGKENVGEEAEDLSQQDSAADVSVNENHCSSAHQDSLAESINGLLNLQESLEREIQKFQEIGKEPTSLHSSVQLASLFTDPQTGEPSSCHHFDADNMGPSDSNSLESQILTLTQTVKHLESKLVETGAILEVKESRISELEATINFSKSTKEETGSITLGSQQETCRGIETELEGLFQKKIEAEIEYLTLSSSIVNMRAASVDQVKLFEEQKALAGEQAQMLNKLGEAENKAATLKEHAEELEKHYGDILGTEEVLKMQRKAFKVTSSFLLQLILLVLVFWWFISQLFPDSEMVVPT